MFITLKTAALAAAVVVATAGSSFAATYAFVDHDANVKNGHKSSSANVNWVAEGQKVKVIDSYGTWYKIQLPGPDGWVRASTLDFDAWDGPQDVSFCLSGPVASFCVND